MHKNTKGFASLILVLFLALVLAGAVGYWVYSRQKDAITYPANKLDKTYTVLAVGDIACDPTNPSFNKGNGNSTDCQHKKVAELMQKQNSDSILLLGDIQYDDGRLSAFEQSFVPAYKNLTAPLVVAAGNHDWQSGSIDGYEQAFSKYLPKAKAVVDGKTYFAVSIGGWKVYILDSDCEYAGGCGKDSNQFNWFKAELASESPKCTVAIWHHPVFTSGLHRNDNDQTRLGDLYNLALENKVDIVLNGHDHDYERFAKQLLDGTASSIAPRSFVVGTGGASLRKLTEPFAKGHEFGVSQYGFLKLQLNPSGYSWEFINIDSQSLDEGSDSCA
jgi:predicted phosphodiesterase